MRHSMALNFFLCPRLAVMGLQFNAEEEHENGTHEKITRMNIWCLMIFFSLFLVADNEKPFDEGETNKPNFKVLID